MNGIHSEASFELGLDEGKIKGSGKDREAIAWILKSIRMEGFTLDQRGDYGLWIKPSRKRGVGWARLATCV